MVDDKPGPPDPVALRNKYRAWYKNTLVDARFFTERCHQKGYAGPEYHELQTWVKRLQPLADPEHGTYEDSRLANFNWLGFWDVIHRLSTKI